MSNQGEPASRKSRILTRLPSASYNEISKIDHSPQSEGLRMSTTPPIRRMEDIDPNFRLNAAVPKDYLFHDPHQAPFSIHGLAADEAVYTRLPLCFLPQCSDGVRNLSRHLAGGCIRFATDSPGLALIFRLTDAGNMPHFTACGQSGMELYEETDGGFRQIANFLPAMNDGRGCRLEQSVYTALPEGLRSYVLYLPLYNGLDELLIGLAPGASLMPGHMPRIRKPIVFYGSSITQGGCAAKTGSCYTHIVCRRLDAEQINLGFSGNAKGEASMAKHIAGLEMSAFVFDYDHNAPDAAHLAATHEPFYRIIRDAQPELPILLLSKPNTDKDPAAAEARAAIIRKTYENAVAAGDTRVQMIDGSTLFGDTDRELCTVDGCHPTDLGFLRMADAITPVLRSMLDKEAKK